MAPKQVDPIFPGEIAHQAIHLKSNSLSIEPQAVSAPMIALTEARPHHRGTGAFGDDGSELIVAIDEKFAGRRQQFRQPAFFAGHGFETAKEFKMFAANRSNHAIMGMNHFHERREFARMVRADLKHSSLMRIFQL